ncbi:hypothetical protein NQZ68_013517 [Dissostichus eleginoides]|nr:hypothetical protein NQZ68_013517 [Dissostichus eleginoides]
MNLNQERNLREGGRGSSVKDHDTPSDADGPLQAICHKPPPPLHIQKTTFISLLPSLPPPAEARLYVRRSTLHWKHVKGPVTAFVSRSDYCGQLLAEGATGHRSAAPQGSLGLLPAPHGFPRLLLGSRSGLLPH